MQKKVSKKKKKRNLVFGINQVWKSFKYKSIWLIIILDTNVISMENYFNIKKWFLFYNVILKCLDKWINIFKKLCYIINIFSSIHSSRTIIFFSLASIILRHPVYYIYKYVCEVMLRKIQSVRFYIEKFLDNSTLSRTLENHSNYFNELLVYMYVRLLIRNLLLKKETNFYINTNKYSIPIF